MLVNHGQHSPNIHPMICQEKQSLGEWVNVVNGCLAGTGARVCLRTRPRASRFLVSFFHARYLDSPHSPIHQVVENKWVNLGECWVNGVQHSPHNRVNRRGARQTGYQVTWSGA